ncbi:MAG: threonine/serine exporter family protein [Acholeplasmataceae bacterium]|jgi:uncharacterized membrane protein YjjB (DUF3815 family)
MPFVLSIIGAIGAVIFVSLIFGVKGRVVIFNGILGGLGWMVYKLIVNSNHSMFLASYIAALCIAFLAQIGARIFKTPATVFFIPSFFPLVPGTLIFEATVSFVMENGDTTLSNLINALLISAGIALAIVTIESIFTIYNTIKRSFQKKVNS